MKGVREMKVTIFVRITGPINSRELWDNIQHYGGMNVTDCTDHTLVYGECQYENLGKIIDKCASYGDIVAEATRERR